MKLNEVPNIDILAKTYTKFCKNRDFWNGATTQSGRECYRFWDDRAVGIAQTLATIVDVTVQEVQEFLTKFI